MNRNKMIAAGLAILGMSWGGVALASGNGLGVETVQAASASTIYAVEDAGTVTVASDGSTLTLIGFAANSGWVATVDSETANEIEIDFVTASTRFRFNAEIEDGSVRAKVEDHTSATVPSEDTTDDSADDSADDNGDISHESNSGSNSGDDSSGDDPASESHDIGLTESFFGSVSGLQTIEVSGLGSITVDVQASTVILVSAAGSNGWTATLDGNESGEAEVLFSKDGTLMEAKIEIEDGALRLRVEIED